MFSLHDITGYMCSLCNSESHRCSLYLAVRLTCCSYVTLQVIRIVQFRHVLSVSEERKVNFLAYSTGPGNATRSPQDPSPADFSVFIFM